MRTWTCVVLGGLLVAGLPFRSAAQGYRWSVGAELGLTRFWGASRNVNPSLSPGIKPYRPTTFGVRVDRRVGRLWAGLGIQYANSGIGIDGEDVVFVTKGELTWVQLAPEVSGRLAALGPAAVLRAFAGPLMDLWIPQGDDTRARFGGQGGLELWMPLGARVATTVRLRGAVAGSLFHETELPDGYELRSMPSLGVGLGLRYGF